MKITYLGQNGFLFDLNGKKLLSDPFISPNPLAKAINVDDITCDYMLITHGHADHVADAESIAKRSEATVISNYEIVEWFGKKDIKGHPMNHGGKWNFDFGTVKYVNAIHSSVLPDGSYGGNPGGFVIWNDEISMYMAGDTALTMDMKLIPMTCPNLEVAILPIGDNFTMGVDDALIASDFIECTKIIGCHFDTFGYIEINKEEAIEKFKAAGKELILMEVGESVEL